MTIKQILNYFGTQAEVARLLNLSPCTISGWKRRKSVPILAQYRLEYLTEGKLKMNKWLKK